MYKIGKPLARLTKKKKRQINTIRNERGGYNGYHTNTKDHKTIL